MPYILERYGDKAIVVNAKSGRHHSLKPIPIENAKAQMRVLESVAEKYDGLRKQKKSSAPEETKPMLK